MFKLLRSFFGALLGGQGHGGPSFDLDELARAARAAQDLESLIPLVWRAYVSGGGVLRISLDSERHCHRTATYRRHLPDDADTERRIDHLAQEWRRIRNELKDAKRADEIMTEVQSLLDAGDAQVGWAFHDDVPSDTAALWSQRIREAAESCSKSEDRGFFIGVHGLRLSADIELRDDAVYLCWGEPRPNELGGVAQSATATDDSQSAV